MQYSRKRLGCVHVAIIFSLCLLALPGGLIAGDEKKTIIATGVAPVLGENTAAARQNAIQDALRQALEQGVGTLMDAKSELRMEAGAGSVLGNDELMERIHTHSQGYVADYTVIKEKQETNGLYRVKVQAVVNPQVLRDTLFKLGLFKPIMDYPRILVLASPDQKFSPAQKTTEGSVIGRFADRHFDLVDPQKAVDLHKEVKDLLETDTVENVAARIGLRHNAEIVILYGVRLGRSEFDGMMETVPVSLETKVIVTTTAQILAAEQQDAEGIGNTPELASTDGARKSGEAIAELLMTKIASWWAEYTANGLPYVLTLKTPPKSDLMIINFQRSLKAIPGVVSVSERSSGGGLTEMMVKYMGTSSEFKEAILTRMKGNAFGEFKDLHVVASKGRFLVLSML
jgi:hypothetical protein